MRIPTKILFPAILLLSAATLLPARSSRPETAIPLTTPDARTITEPQDTIPTADAQDSTVYTAVREGGTLTEAVISTVSPQSRVAEPIVGVQKIDINELARTPVLFGERDIMKSIQLLPGITSEGDGTSGFQVRGGTSSQNLVLLDGATIHNSGHLLGFFSAFNDEAISSASLYKGQIPSQFGGGTSSVFDITTKNGSFDRYHVSGTVGLLSARVNVEGPIVKDKLSFYAAARRSYADLFLKMLKRFRDDKLNFYDANAKLAWRASDKDLVTVSFFSGRDKLGLVDVMDFVWRNNTVSGRWTHNLGDGVRSNLTLTLSNYGCDVGMEIMDMDRSFDGFIKQIGLKEQFSWRTGPRNEVNFGYQTSILRLKSAEWTIDALHEKELRNAWENALWAGDEWKPVETLTLSAGLRLTSFSAMGGSPYYSLDADGKIAETFNYPHGTFVKTWLGVEPRVSLNWTAAEGHSLKLGYSRNSQNIHAIRSLGMSMPFDRYTMSSNLVRPETADQVSLGYIGLVRDGMFEFSAEAYYKHIENVYDYRDGMSFISSINIEELIEGGKGRAYGLELCARKNFGHLTGWVSYTLSWAQNKIDGINGNRWYTASNDRRHDVSIVAVYSVTPTWDISATWVYNTGQALTAPSAKYEIDGETYYYYAERNGYRAPAYHRLDLSATNTKVKKRYTRQWSFGVYNAYCRYNPFIIMFRNDDTNPTGTRTVQYSLFGIIPSVSYTFIF